MSFTNPPAAPPAAVPIPSRLTDSQVEFDAKTDAYLNWLDTFRAWLAGLVDWCATFVTELAATQETINSAATAAIGAADAALAASHFKGMWIDLAGPLPRPACVKHEGRFWLLLTDLPDVSAAEPGVSSAWTAMDAGRVAQTITADAVAVPGVYYVASAAGITLTVPGGFMQGDFLGGRNVSAGDCYIDWGGQTLMSQAPESPMRWPTLGRFETTYNGSTFA